MKTGAIWKHVGSLGGNILKGFFIRLCLIGSATLSVRLSLMMLGVDTQGAPVALRGLMAASVLFLIAFTWFTCTLWFMIRLRASIEQTKVGFVELKQTFTKK